MSVRCSLITGSLVLFIALLQGYNTVIAQCTNPINNFPYLQNFETTDGAWFSGGTGSDWAWGTPSKPVIQTAGSGSRCWIIGGLTGSSYTNGEASWLQSPCFNFTNLRFPYISMKLFWEMERQFDGASFQYSIDNGTTWTTLGSANETGNCLTTNWFNFAPITYLSPLTTIRDGWSGNIQPASGSCRAGNGSNGWVTATHSMLQLAGEPSVIFRFIFGAGTICNNYDGFAVDDILISEAPPNIADFSYTCTDGATVSFTNTSALCPDVFSWSFGDINSGTNNTSASENPAHTFSGPGIYTVSLTVAGPGNASSSISKDITILGLTTSVIKEADCQTNAGGSASVVVTGGSGPYTYNWNTTPIQTNAVITNAASGTYAVTVGQINACPATASLLIPLDNTCTGVYFPSAFTPNNDGRNDDFGVNGGVGAITSYKLSIYNRWGQLVFQTTNPFQKWDGTYKGVKMETGSLVWYAEVTLRGQSPERKKGTITLLR